MHSDAYDVIVIGAGNGGLTAAATTAGKGLKTLLLERHNLPGGFATSFVRGRFEFEPSLHEISDFGPSGNKGGVRKLFEDRLGLELEFVPVPEAYRLIIPDEKGGRLDVTMPFGEKAFIDKVESYVPGSKKSVEKFVALCKEVVDAFAYIGESRGDPDKKILMSKYSNFLKTAPYSLQDVFDALKMPYLAQKIVSAYWCYIGMGVDKMSFTIFGAMFYKYLAVGAFVPRYRSHYFTSALDKKIREAGGEILYNTEAVKILTENGKVTGVKTSKGDVFKTDFVIANMSPHLAYGKLIDDPPEIAVKTCNARKVGFSGFVVYMGLNKTAKELGINDYSYFIYGKPDTNDIYKGFGTLGRPVGQAAVCLNNAVPDCSPPGACILSLTTLFSPESWENVKAEEYFKLKERIADELIDEFEKAVGASVRDSIEELEIATPATFARYTGAYGGSVYGYEPSAWDSIMPRLMAMGDEEYIKGLKFAGGFSVRCHGYSSSLMSGELAAQLVMRDMKGGKII
jgi:Phytoene dehydrogenase and related proteins